MKVLFVPIFIVVACFFFFTNATAQCNFKKSKVHPDFEFIKSPIGPTFFQWELSIGKNKIAYFIVLHVEPGFVTAGESLKKKPPMKPQDALVFHFDKGDTVVLHPSNEINAKLESAGPASVWRYHIRIEVGREIITRFASNNPVKAIVEINGKEMRREIKPRQQLSLNKAAKCVL